MSIEEILETYGPSWYWEPLPHGGWKHNLATVSNRCVFEGPVVLLRGEFSFGTYYTGLYLTAPFQLVGLPWFANVCAPGELKIGCQRHTLEVWKADLDVIAAAHRVAPDRVPLIRSVIELAERFPGPEYLTT